MKSELNLKVKDIQALGGLSLSAARQTLVEAKKASNKRNADWLSLKEFCCFRNIDYFLARGVFYTSTA